MRRILIACRGEISGRIARTIKRMGDRPLAIYDKSDARAPFVQEADESYELLGEDLSQTYLDGDRLVAIALSAGANGIHPGYGFLSEDPFFAEKVQQAGLVWIGPAPDTMRLMADKARARQEMRTIGIPTIPGYDGKDQNLDRLLREAEVLGYPVMLKASFGGGGRGIRVLACADDLKEQAQLAMKEAEKFFGHSELILEKKIESARHIEVQILCDSQGNVFTLGDRECSVQRRHQKLIEEGPAPNIKQETRDRLWDNAKKVASYCDYQGAGTVEFLVDACEEIFFLEMNTRIQVEHPVTEMITGIDLVKEQVRIAWGLKCGLVGQAMTSKGHAIEARVNLEDPYSDFAPQSGAVHFLELPRSDGIRVDHDLAEGLKTRGDLDSMVAKVIAHGRDRTEAISRLISALEKMKILGVGHNVSYLLQILNSHDFLKAGVHSQWLESTRFESRVRADDVALAAVALWCAQRSVSIDLACLRVNGPSWTPFRLSHGQQKYDGKLSFLTCDRSFEVSFADQSFEIELVHQSKNQLFLSGSDHKASICYHLEGRQLWLSFQGRNLCFINHLLEAPSKKVSDGDRMLRAPMAGRVIRVCVQPNETVSLGDTLMIFEAMKMEHEVKSGHSGRVESIYIEVGQQLSLNQKMILVSS